MEILNLVKDLLGSNAEIFAYAIIGLSTIGYLIFLLVKNIPNIVLKVFKNRQKEERLNHTIASNYRKSIVPKIKKELSYLGENTEVDRVLLFEYSNGTSNLVGLPFLYATATVEVVKPKIQQVSYIYQKMNVSLFADFIEEMEQHSYFYVKNIDEIKNKYPMLYNYMYSANVKSTLFYVLYNEESSIGFIAASSIIKEFERSDVLPKIAEVAQLISS